MEEEGHRPARGGAQDDGRSVRRAHRDRARAVRRVRARRRSSPASRAQFYQQFALTIVSATVISAFVSLTLSPALARADAQAAQAWRGAATGLARIAGRASREASIAASSGLSHDYGRLTARRCARWCIVGIVYVALIVARRLAVHRDADRLHPGAGPGLSDRASSRCRRASSLQRTDAVMREAIEDRDEATRRPTATVAFAGLDGATFSTAPNAGAMFIRAEAACRSQATVPTRSQQRAAPALRQRSTAATSWSSPPPPGPRHRHRRRLQDDDRGPQRPRLSGARRRRMAMMMEAQPGARASPAPSPPSTRARRASPPNRPRARRADGRAGAERLLDARHLSRLDLCQRLQLSSAAPSA